MYYHVRITRKRDKKQTVKLDLSPEDLEARILAAHRTGRPFMLGGSQHSWTEIEQIRINRTEESSETLRPVVKAERDRQDRESSVVFIGGPGLDWYVAASGDDVTDELLAAPPGAPQVDTSQHPEAANAPSDPRMVMVVHGRNSTLKRSMFGFLRAIGLEPLEWSTLRAATKKASPYIGEILDEAFSQVQAVVVLLSGDDEARLREEFVRAEDPLYEKQLTPQGRPNVLFEAGMALASHPTRTVIVEIGNLRPFSDIAGRHTVRLANDPQTRHDLAQRLITAGCPVDLTSASWITEGDFGD